MITENDDMPPFDKEQTVAPVPMSVEDAGARLAQGDDSMVIFINNENKRLSILRQLPNGQLELIRINH